MAVRIRLRRMGRKKSPQYRVVVADKASPRDGRFVETLGQYQPLAQPARLILNLERVDYWIEQGATPSDTVRSLIARARKGGDETVHVGEVDLEAEKARKAEELAARRKAEAELAKAEEEAEKAAKAEAEAEKAAKAKTEAAEAKEAEEAKAETADAKAEKAETAPEAEGDAAEGDEEEAAAEDESEKNQS